MAKECTAVHPQARRRVPLEFNARGEPCFSGVCSPERFKVRALAVPPPRHVIPVIFVPGIMGSNLQVGKPSDPDGAAAWRPPNGIGQGFVEWKERFRQPPKDRQLQLNPANTKVDTRGKVSLPRNLYTLTGGEARRRGWGEVHWGSYGPVLTELERAMNDQYEDCGTAQAKEMAVWTLAKRLRKPAPAAPHPSEAGFVPAPAPAEEDILKTWRPVKGATEALSEAAFARLDDYYYPVWACGYNWLQSNEQSARRLLARIDEALAWYGQTQYFIPEGRVIVVTHSMGGLVARRAAQLAPEKILGVVHGVQPVGGAPVVYRRLRAGTEVDGGWWDIEGAMIAAVLGWDAADITCVMANSPGPLELLPTRHYPPGWLRFECEANGECTPVAEPLPKADPYTEIYARRVQDVWWGMVDETLIDPAKLEDKDGKPPMKRFVDALIEAEGFHDGLDLYCHPNTWAHYGSDADQRSFGAVRWVTRRMPPESLRGEALMGASASAWTLLGKTHLGEGDSRFTFKLAEKARPGEHSDENAGDSTVPRPSGRLIEECSNVQHAFRMRGFEHGASYKHGDVLDNTIYCIGHIVQQAIPAAELPQSKGAQACSAPPDPSDTPASAEAPSLSWQDSAS